MMAAKAREAPFEVRALDGTLIVVSGAAEALAIDARAQLASLDADAVEIYAAEMADEVARRIVVLLEPHVQPVTGFERMFRDSEGLLTGILKNAELSRAEVAADAANRVADRLLPVLVERIRRLRSEARVG